MRVAGHRVTMYRTPTGMDTRIDGASMTPPATPQPLPGGGTIGTYGLADTVIVVWPDGSLAIVRAVGVFPEYFRFTVDLGLAPARLGHMVGLLGDADGGIGNHVDDLVTRGGTAGDVPRHAVRRAVRHVRQQLADQQRRVAVRLRRRARPPRRSPT